MKVYHGSADIVKKPDVMHSFRPLDFGKGFYLSADINQAQRMAEQRTLILQTRNPTVSRFQFDEQWLQSPELRVKIFENYSEEWAQFVLMNRDMNVAQPAHDYDIVYGPIADDGVTFQLRRYKAGAITLSELVQELRFSQGITFQYYFGTQRALDKLKAL